MMVPLLLLLTLETLDACSSICREGLQLQDYAEIDFGGYVVSCSDIEALCSNPENGCFRESCKGAQGLCWESCTDAYQAAESVGCCGTRDGCWIQKGYHNEPHLLTDWSIHQLSSTIAASGCSEVWADSIHINGMVTSLEGLEALTHVGRLGVHQTSVLRSLQGLDGLKTAGEINIVSNFQLSSLQGLGGLSFACSLQVDGNIMLTSMQGLEGLHSLGGCIFNRSLPILSNLSKPILAHLSVPSDEFRYALRLNMNNELTSLQGLDSLVKVTGIVGIENHARLTSMHGLGALVNITGSGSVYKEEEVGIAAGLEVSNNAMLASLEGLQSLEKVGPHIIIMLNPSLISINGVGTQTIYVNMETILITDNALLCVNPEHRRLYYATARWVKIQNCSCRPGLFPYSSIDLGDQNWSAEICTTCPAGSFCIGGQAKAQPCPLGSNSTGGSTACECSNGFEPADPSPDSNTETWSCIQCREFSTSAGHNAPCFCDRVTHAVEDYFGDGSICNCPRQHFMHRSLQRCEECGDGQLCDWDFSLARAGSSLRPPAIQPGYWAAAVVDEAKFSGHSIWRCFSMKTCLGNSTCAANRAGVACGDCLPGFYGGPDGPCLPCNVAPAAQRAILGFLMGVTVLVAVLMLFAMNIFRSRAAKTISLKKNIKAILRTLKQLVKYFQMLGVVSTFHIQWPINVQQLFSFVKKISLNVDGALREHCLTDRSSVELLVYYRCAVPLAIFCMLMVSVPLARAAAFAMAWAPCARFRKLSQRVPTLADAGQLAFQVFALFFISILTAVISVFGCRSNPNGHWVVREFPQMECFTDRWLQLVPVLGVAVFLYVMCYLLGLIYIVRQCSQSLAVSEGRCRGAFGFIVEDFRTTQIVFPIVMVIKDIFINVVSLLPIDAGFQLSCSLSILALYLYMVLQESPFEDPISNKLELWTTSTLMLQIAVVGCMSFFKEQNTRAENFFIGLSLASLVPAAWMLILQVLLAIPCLARRAPRMLKPLSDQRWEEHLSQIFEANGGCARCGALQKILRELDPVDRSRVDNVMTWNPQLNSEGILRPRGSRIIASSLSPWEWSIRTMSKKSIDIAEDPVSIHSEDNAVSIHSEDNEEERVLDGEVDRIDKMCLTAMKFSL